MSEHAEKFIQHLIRLANNDKCAMAVLRRSLRFRPGEYPPSYPYVERFAAFDKHASDPYRKALYLTAGLFAYHPKHCPRDSFARVFGLISSLSKSQKSQEKRFISLLSSNPENLDNYLRKIINLIKNQEGGINYVQLLKDISYWSKDNTRLRWARDFYVTFDLKDESLPKSKENKK